MSDSRPNVLWITLDSVRADHTSLHNYGRGTTPNLVQIAEKERAVSFKHGIAHSTRTPVSVPSMLTGLYPSCHQMIGTKSGNVLPPEMMTAPELLSRVGYHTIGISENGYAGAAKGLDARFDEFIKSPPSINTLISPRWGASFLKYVINARDHGPGWTIDKKAHQQSSFFTTDISKRKLRAAYQKDKPVFAYIHYNDPHHPYIPPLKYLRDIDITSDEAVNFAERMHEELYNWMANKLPLSEYEWELLRELYDATIKYTDAMVGNLFNFVQKLPGETIVVITADHGDLFGEYGLLGHHMVVHDGLVHVPLVTHGIDNVAHHNNKPTQHIDMMETLLSIAGADTTQFQGYDLRKESRKVAISQDLRGTVDDSEAENYERIRQHNPDADLSHLPESMVSAFRTTEYKLVRTDEWTQLYRLPDETTDISHEQVDVLHDLETFANDWMASTGQPFRVSPDKANLSEKTERHLRDMGYL
jgi:uncharacterized sulfatase